MKDTKHAIIATIAATLCVVTVASANDVAADGASPSRDLAGAAAATFCLTSAIVPSPGALALLALAGCVGLTVRTKG